MSQKRILAVILALLAIVAMPVVAADKGLKKGTPDLKMAGPLAFGPEGVLFIADPLGAAIFAVNTGAAKGDSSKVKVELEDVEGKIASMLGVGVREVRINDLAVNPANGDVYISATRGQGAAAKPALLKVSANKLSAVSLEGIKFAKATLPNPAASKRTRRGNQRMQSITDMQYVAGRLLIAGLSNEEFASNLRSIAFPFNKVDSGAGVEIFHGAHGRFETRSPIRTFATYNIGKEPHLVAAYTCTPLVKFAVKDLVPGKKVKGTTIAELGNRNRPLDMVVYKKGGKDYILLANSARGVMKITTDEIGTIKGIEARVGGGGKAGLTYDTIDTLKGVQQLDRLNDTSAVLLVRNDDGVTSLKTVDFP